MKEFIPFQKVDITKVNLLARLEFELAWYDSEAQHVSY